MATAAQSIGISLVEKIRADILAARLKPGAKVTAKMLCEINQCGASPVREALNQLTSEGLVLRIDRRGFFVSGISREEFEDVLFNRCFLESEALARSIARGDTAWEEEILVSHYRLDILPREIDGADGRAPNPEWEEAHRRFHMSLVSACGSEILLANCDRLNRLNDRYRFAARLSQREVRPVEDEHTVLRDLVLSRKTDEAVRFLVDHYRRTGNSIFEADIVNLAPARKGRPAARQSHSNYGRNTE